MKHIPEIKINTIKHKNQRYQTVGDYICHLGQWEINVSKMNNPDYEFLVALHEMIELYLVQKEGIKIKDIDTFDIEFEKNRKNGNTDEPGNSQEAPYYFQHRFATEIEKLVAKKLGVNWKKYDNEVINL